MKRVFGLFNKGFLIIALSFGLLLWFNQVALLMSAPPVGEDNIGVQLGEVAPDFTLLNLEGEEVSLSDYRGKNLLVNFWATWCPPCREEMPDLIRFHEDNDDFVVLAVNIREGKETIKEFTKWDNYTFPILLDKEGEVSRDYLITAIPTSYFIGVDGEINYIQRGMVNLTQLYQIREEILNNN